MASQKDWDKVHEIKEKFCSALLRNVHVNYVGVSLKKVAGQSTDTPTIVVAVKKKMPVSELSDNEKIPAFLDGVPTDVIESDLNLVKLEDIPSQQQAVQPTAEKVGSVDPYAYSATVTSGMSMATYKAPLANGTVGCFVTVTGDPKLTGITVGGKYLVTCQHVVASAPPSDRIIIPASKREGKPPEKNDRANYVNGRDSPEQSVDVAAVKLDDKVAFKNDIPTATSVTRATGVLTGWPLPGTVVFKYGSTTWYTEGYVEATNVSGGGYDDLMKINGKKKGTRSTVIADSGDSGSIIVISSNSNVTGQLFAVNNDTKISGGYTQCYAYRMDKQLSTLAGNWKLS